MLLDLADDTDFSLVIMMMMMIKEDDGSSDGGSGDENDNIMLQVTFVLVVVREVLMIKMIMLIMISMVMLGVTVQSAERMYSILIPRIFSIRMSQIRLRKTGQRSRDGDLWPYMAWSRVHSGQETKLGGKQRDSGTLSRV